METAPRYFLVRVPPVRVCVVRGFFFLLSVVFLFILEIKASL
jgi:hypothetical protein